MKKTLSVAFALALVLSPFALVAARTERNEVWRDDFNWVRHLVPGERK